MIYTYKTDKWIKVYIYWCPTWVSGVSSLGSFVSSVYWPAGLPPSVCLSLPHLIFFCRSSSFHSGGSHRHLLPKMLISVQLEKWIRNFSSIFWFLYVSTLQLLKLYSEIVILIDFVLFSWTGNNLLLVCCCSTCGFLPSL